MPRIRGNGGDWGLWIGNYSVLRFKVAFVSQCWAFISRNEGGMVSLCGWKDSGIGVAGF